MLDFFNYYLHPSSPSRSKLAIHLIAQSKSVDDSILSKATQVLGLSSKEPDITSLGINKDKKDGEDGEIIPVKMEGNGTKPFVITDVREFKSLLLVSAGPQPVRHISEFEELESKL